MAASSGGRIWRSQIPQQIGPYAATYLTVADQLEQQVRILIGMRDIADLFNDQRSWPGLEPR